MTNLDTIPIGLFAYKITIELDKVTVEFYPETYDELNSLIAQHRTSKPTASTEGTG